MNETPPIILEEFLKLHAANLADCLADGGDGRGGFLLPRPRDAGIEVDGSVKLTTQIHLCEC